MRIFATAIVLWCNGSTTVFGSVCGGSNPPGTTEKPRPNIWARLFCCQNGTIHKYIKRTTSPTMPDDKP